MRPLLALALVLVPVLAPIPATSGQAQPASRAEAAPAPAITEAEVRAFVARQEADWNAGRLDRYFAGFTPDAVFTDQAYVGRKPPVPYGSSTRTEAQANARRVFVRKPWPRETAQVFRVQAEGDGMRVTSTVGSIVWEQGRARRLCASRDQVLVRREGAIRATSRTDTFVRCRGG